MPEPVPYPVIYGVRYAASMFAMMLRPEMRGQKFTWENFPELVVGLVRSSLCMAYPDGNPSEDDENLAAESAREFAAHLVRRRFE